MRLYLTPKHAWYYQDDDASDEEESDGDGGIIHEEFCAMCGGDEGLISCSTCVSAFHMDCHDPPLLREPRYTLH